MTVSISTLDDITADDCPHNEYCILKEMIHSSGLTNRTVEQYKCYVMLRYDFNVQNKTDISTEEAALKWVREGYAKEFAKIYQEGMDHNEIYFKIKQRIKEAKKTNGNGKE